MSKNAEAVLQDGTKIEYVIKENPPSGTMKHTYFSPDRSYVVQFYNDPKNANDSNVRKRIEAIIGKYNPTLSEEKGGAKGNSEFTAEYFSKNFCWPRAIVESPEFGIVCPAYPGNFFFTKEASSQLELKGKDKKSSWFTSRNRRLLNASELGDFRSMLKIAISLARSIRRMHQAGLSHSDLSCNNVLIDPKTGTCIIIDIDSLVVPGLFPPEVAGTQKYIAPEVYETMELAFDDPKRKLPCSATDLHAMAVLIYEYFFLRHPLMGPKIFSKESPEKDDFLAFGPKAIFIENPKDKSNRPKDLKVTVKDLGPMLESLFMKAFVDGLHNPESRPSAMDWERGLVKTWDMLQPCENPKCASKWFILHDAKHPVCPFCGHKAGKNKFVRIQLKRQMRGHSGTWCSAGEINAYDSLPLFEWHVFSDIFPDEKADRSMMAYVCKYQDKWFLVNQNIKGMISPSGNIVPSGQAIQLSNGAVFRMSNQDNGYLAEVICAG